MTTEEKQAENKKIVLWSAGSFVVGAALAFLATALILNKKYAKLEAQYWGM